MNMKSKNAPEELKKLHDNRALILLVELMGFLHDVGKLSEELYKEHAKRYEKDKNNLVPPVLIEVFQKKFGDLLRDCISNNVLIKINNASIEGFQLHNTTHPPENWIEKIIELSDNKDSSEDRSRAFKGQEEFKASVFGVETKLEKHAFKSKRRDFYKRLVPIFSRVIDFDSNGKPVHVKKNTDWKRFHSEIKEVIKDYFSDALAETKRAVNDITLFDHAYMTGCISKAILAKVIINPEIGTAFQTTSNTQHFDEELNLSLLMLSFDGFGFISRGVNLLDVQRRKKVLGEIKDSVKDLLEVEYPIGNCIYEDENNLCFLVLPLEDESFDYLKKEVYKIFNGKAFGIFVPVIGRRQNLQYYGKNLTELKEESEKSIREGLIKDFEPKWIEEWKNVEGKEKCVVCGKLPQWKGKDSDYLCALCWNLRYKVKEKSEKEDSSWLDEIADENGKIAVIVGAFHPVDRWLSGKFLNYQYIRTLEDIIENTSLSFQDAAIKFVENFYDEMNKGDFVASLRTPIPELTKLSEGEKRILGWRSKVGEVYYRLSEDNQTVLKEKSQLSKEEINKIAQEVVDVTTKKPPSPSRLHRIWRELQNFSDKAIKQGRGKMPEGKRLKFKLDKFEGEEGIYKAEIEGIGRLEVLHEGNGKFFTIERIDKNNQSDEVEDSYLKNYKQIIEKANRRNKKISVFKDRIKLGEFGAVFEKEGEYKQFREILSSPNGFMFVLPAKKAFEVVRDINEQFEMEFSKALGKLSLNIGIVFSHRKSPIYVSLDAARRFREEFKVEDEEGYISVEKQHLCETLESTNGEHPYRYLVMPIRVKGKEIFWKVKHTLGDGRIDRYHPYFVSSDDKLLHIKEITFKDKLRVYLNYFDFEHLDTTVRRFDIVLGGDKKRIHTIIDNEGPRPYLLEDLYKFERLREIFEAIGSWTPIRDVEALAASKREDWAQSVKFEDMRGEYEELVESMLENKLSRHFDKENWRGNIKPFLKECIIGGSFFDAIELFGSIMKMDLRGDRK